MPKLFLHVGTQKTGTTALQTFACANAIRLEKLGVIYPDFSPYKISLKDGHHDLAHSIARDRNRKMTKPQLDHLVKTWRDRAERDGKDVFLSAEALYRHKTGRGTYFDKRDNFLRCVSSLFENFEVEIILVFRRPDDYLRSLYQEKVAKAPNINSYFQDVVASNLGEAEYFENALCFSNHFTNVRCLTYENLVTGNGLYRNFFEELGVDVSQFDSLKTARKSLTPFETQVKNYANRFLENREQNREFLSWLRSDEIRAVLGDAVDHGSYDLWPSHDFRANYLKSREEDLRKLKDRFFTESQGDVFPALEDGDTLPVTPPIPRYIEKMVKARVKYI